MADETHQNVEEELEDIEDPDGEQPDAQELADFEEEMQAVSRREVHVSDVGRKVPITIRPDDQGVRLRAHYSSRQLQRASPMAMLKEAIVAQLADDISAALPQFQIAWSYDPQLKPQVMNARAALGRPTSLEQLIGELATGACSCREYHDCYKVPITDSVVQQYAPAAAGTYHIRTMDPGFIRSAALRELLAKGLNHIPLAATDTTTTIDTNVALAEQFMQRVVHPTATALGYTVGPSWYDTARRSAHDWTVHQLSMGQGGQEETAEMTDSIRRDIAELQGTVLICEVDKAANTCCFMCPKYAQLLVLLRLEGSSDFERVGLDAAGITSALQQQLGAIDSKLVGVVQEGRLPIMRVAYKAHKKSYRYLTNAAGSLLSPLNSIAQSITSKVREGSMGALATLNSEVTRFTGAHTQSYIVVENAQQVVLNTPDRITSDCCADITKCFENIPIDVQEQHNLQEAMKRQVQQAFQHQAAVRGREQLLVITKLQAPYNAEWQHVSSGSRAQDRVYLTQEKALGILHTAFTNAYVTAGGQVYRQARGIPMGADYSPDACNLYFMRYEADAVRRICILTNGSMRQQLCREWLYCFRMMDDIRMINAPTLAGFVRSPDRPGDSSVLGWIYPPCVGIEVTFDVSAGGDSRVSTQYLDCLTHINQDGTYSVEIYDKQQKLDFQPVHYIARSSNRLLGNSYKMVLGQAYRIAAICSTAELAAKHIGFVLQKLMQRGFARQRLLDTLNTWTSTNPAIPGKPFDLLDVMRAVTHRSASWRS